MPEPSVVPLTARYSAAASELNTRIQARQHVLLFYATGSATLLGFVVNGQVPYVRENPAPILAVMMGLIPSLFSLAFSLWIRHHESVIGVLAAFCRVCEEYAGEEDRLPSWFSRDQGFQYFVLAHRKLFDLGFSFVSYTTAVVSTLKAALLMVEGSFLASAMIFGAFFLTGLANWLVYGVEHLRLILHDAVFVAGPEGKGTFKLRSERKAGQRARLWLVAFLAIVCAAALVAAFGSDGGLHVRWIKALSGLLGAAASWPLLLGVRRYDFGPVARSWWLDASGRRMSEMIVVEAEVARSAGSGS